MATNRTQLVVEILSDTAKATQGLNETAGRFESFAKKAATVVAGAFAFDKIKDGIGIAVSAAADLEQAMGSVDAVFKSNAAAVHSWASDTSDSIRLPQREFESLAAIIGTNLKSAGVPMDQLAVKTRELIQAGADLGAQMGVPIVDAVASVRSALVGEYDAIQNLGIAINGNAVDHRALADAHGDTEVAATQAAKSIAAMEIILEGVGDASGAAARESETFTGRVETLKERLDNMAAAAAGPLLDALGGLLDKLSGGVPIITSVATALGSLVGALLEAPAGIQAPLIAFGAWLIFGPRLIAMLGTLKVSMIAFRQEMVLQQSLAAMGGKSLGTLGAAAATAQTRWSGLAKTVGGAGLFAVAIASITLIVDKFDDLDDGMDKAQGALDQVGQALAANGALWDENSRKAQLAAVTASEPFKALVAGGADGGEAMRALSGDAEALNRVLAGIDSGAIQDISPDMLDDAVAFAAAQHGAQGYAEELIKAGKASSELAKEGAAVGPTIEESMTAAEDAARKAAEELAAAVRVAQDAASRTVVNRALTDVTDAADDATRAVGFLSVAIDGLTGGTRTYEAALAGFNKSATGTAGTFTEIAAASGEATAANQLNRDAMIAWNVNALTQNEAGQKAYDSLTQLQGGYETLVGSAYASAAANKDNAGAIVEAQNNAGYAYDTFISMAGAMGISEEQAATLAANLGILDAQQLDPKIFQLIAEDEEARAKVAALQAAGVDPVTIHMIPDDLATPAIESAISYVDKNGSVVTIPLHADAEPAEATADSFTAEKRQTNEVAILANSAPARNAMIAFLADYSKMTLTATLNANSAPARAAMEAFRGDYSGFQLTATILGNSAPARQAISALENGNYSVTVKIIADASPYMATFNSLPTTKTITQNVVTIPAPAPAPAFAGGVTTLGRSLSLSAQPMATSSTSTGGGTVINVSGALDPDAVARQIESLLRRRDRRSSGPAI